MPQIDEWVKSNDKDSFLTSRRMIREEGARLRGAPCLPMLYAFPVDLVAPTTHVAAHDPSRGPACIDVM